MTDPNLDKIVNANINEIKQGRIGTTITYASGYLDYMYGYHNRDKRKIELTEFIDKLKLLSNQLQLEKEENKNVQSIHKQQKRKRARRN